MSAGATTLGGSARGALSNPADDLRRLERATAELQAPFAVVDLDAFWFNAAEMERRAAAPRPC